MRFNREGTWSGLAEFGASVRAIVLKETPSLPGFEDS